MMSVQQGDRDRKDMNGFLVSLARWISICKDKFSPLGEHANKCTMYMQ